MTRHLPLALVSALAVTACAPAPATAPAADNVTLSMAVSLQAAPARSLQQVYATPTQNPNAPVGANNAAAGTPWSAANVSKVTVHLYQLSGETMTEVGTGSNLTGWSTSATQGFALSNLRHNTSYKLVLEVFGDDGYVSYTAARAQEPDAYAKSTGERRVDAAFAQSAATLASAAGTSENVKAFATTGQDYLALSAATLTLRNKNYNGEADNGLITLTPGAVATPSAAETVVSTPRTGNFTLNAAGGWLDTGIDVPNGKTATLFASTATIAGQVVDTIENALFPFGPLGVGTLYNGFNAHAVVYRLGATGGATGAITGNTMVSAAAVGRQRLFFGINKLPNHTYSGSFALGAQVNN